MSTGLYSLPLLDQVVDLVPRLKQSQTVSKVFVVLGLGLTDLLVMHLEVPEMGKGHLRLPLDEGCFGISFESI